MWRRVVRTEGDNQTYGSHNIQWIRPYHWERPRLSTDKWPDPATYTKSGVALPGAGNFLIFDNGCYNPTGIGRESIEVNPRIGASGTEEVAVGKYIWPVVAGYKTTNCRAITQSRQLAWSYQPPRIEQLLQPGPVRLQRLPNGNTSINAAGTAICSR